MFGRIIANKKSLTYITIALAAVVLASILIIIRNVSQETNEDTSQNGNTTEILQALDGQEIEIQRDSYSQNRLDYAEGNYKEAIEGSLLIADDNNTDVETRVRAYVVCIESAIASSDAGTANRCKQGAESIVEQLYPQAAIDDWKIIINDAFNGIDESLTPAADELDG